MNVNFTSVSSFFNSNIDQKNNYLPDLTNIFNSNNAVFKQDTFISSAPKQKPANQPKVDISLIGTVGRIWNNIKTNVSDFSDKIIGTKHKNARGEKVHLKAEAATLLDNLVNIASSKGIRVQINSAYRSVEHQTRLWNQALKKYGSVSAARKWVAPPGKSQHNKGDALDINMYRNGKKISQKEFDTVIAQAGFYRPMSWEGWHIEPLSTKKARNLA